MRINILNVCYIIAFAISIFSNRAFAQVPQSEPAKSIYLRLMNDLYDEVMTMDAVKESDSERETFIHQMQALLNSSSAFNPTAEYGKSWSGFWPPKVLKDTSRQAHEVEVIQAEPFDFDSEHGLEDRQTYVERRLGKAASQEIESSNVEVAIYGGHITSAMAQLSLSGRSVVSIPSFYDTWGIKKFLAVPRVGSTEKPLLIFSVPPSAQYIRHYGLMLSYLRAKPQLVLDRVDQKNTLKRSRQALAKISNRVVTSDPDYIVLGYAGDWLREVRKEDSPFRLEHLSPLVSAGVGIKGQSLDLVSKESGQKIHILVLQSDKTIWGESSSLLITAALDLKPKGVLFFGSAGGVNPNLNEYALSVPKTFKTSVNSVPIENLLISSSNNKFDSKNTVFGAAHGNTNSPLEQTTEYLEKVDQQKIDTIDVEQSLIAQAIAEYNEKNNTQIKFGAVNIITDLPGRILLKGRVEVDLDRIDLNLKRLRREQAVLLAMGVLEKIENERLSRFQRDNLCRKIFQ